MSNIFKTLLFIPIICVSCWSSITYTNREADKKDAQKVVDSFYIYLQNNTPEKVIHLLSKKLLKVTDTATIYKTCEEYNEKLGQIQQTEITEWTTLVKEGFGSKSAYVFRYKVNRELHNSSEIIKLVKEDNEIKIALYDVNSPGLENEKR